MSDCVSSQILGYCYVTMWCKAPLLSWTCQIVLLVPIFAFNHFVIISTHFACQVPTVIPTMLSWHQQSRNLVKNIVPFNFVESKHSFFFFFFFLGNLKILTHYRPLSHNQQLLQCYFKATSRDSLCNPILNVPQGTFTWLGNSKRTTRNFYLVGKQSEIGHFSL